MTTAHLEPVAGILRVFSDGKQFGEKYDWSCVVRWLSPTVVELCGAVSAPTPAQWRAIRNVLEAAGVERAEFERRCGANKGRHVILRKS